MKQLGVDLYDEHFYRNEEWFLSHGLRYDSYDRKGPKVFAGEYACHGKGKYSDGKEKKCNHFETSLYEAAFLTGVERNADIVHMATYAPLFAHVKGWQWRPDLIWFDNFRSFRSISYYVQQLYGQYKGTNVLPLTMNGRNVCGDDDQNGLFASAVCDKNNGSIYIKVANVSDKAQPVKLNLKGLKKATGAKVITLTSSDPVAENTLENPEKITPKESDVTLNGTTIDTEVAPKSFNVFVIK
jgi:alpha-L-arabinofuranosidase